MAAFATPADLRIRWPTIPQHLSDGTLAVLLADASLWLRSSFPTIPDTPNEHTQGVLTLVCCAMVRRAINVDDADGLSAITDTQGPFSTTRQFHNAEGNFYITSQERAMLEGCLNKRRGIRCVEATGW